MVESQYYLCIAWTNLRYSLVTIPQGVTEVNDEEEWGVGENIKNVILWLTRGATLPYQFYSYLNRREIICRAVR